MKKKGLIIATIVMVLVLAVSLTTATYAWFTAESKATISSIAINTASAANVQVGLKADGVFDDAASQDDFVSGACTKNSQALGFTGTTGYGPAIETGISLDGLNKAIGTGVVNTSADSSWNLTGDNKTIIKANGTYVTSGNNVTSTTVEATSVVAAIPNEDYIDWVLGFSPTLNNIDTFTFNITISPSNDQKTTLGLLAALHIRYSWDGENYNDLDLYGEKKYSDTRVSVTSEPVYTTQTHGQSNVPKTNTTPIVALPTVTVAGASGSTVGAMTSVTDSAPVLAGGINIAFTQGTTVQANSPAGSGLEKDGLYQLHFQLFYAGYDLDCINAGLGAGANIYFTVTNTTYTVAAE